MSDFRFIVDENVPTEIIRYLLAKKYNVLVPVRRLKDIELGKIAKRERRIILTHDKDFANPFLFPPKEFHGIIRLRIHPPVITDITRVLEKLFLSFSPKDFKGKLIILEKNGSRVI